MVVATIVVKVSRGDYRDNGSKVGVSWCFDNSRGGDCDGGVMFGWWRTKNGVVMMVIKVAVMVMVVRVGLAIMPMTTMGVVVVSVEMKKSHGNVVVKTW